jgi:hypothetical protein
MNDNTQSDVTILITIPQCPSGLALLACEGIGRHLDLVAADMAILSQRW